MASVPSIRDKEGRSPSLVPSDTILQSAPINLIPSVLSKQWCQTPLGPTSACPPSMVSSALATASSVQYWYRFPTQYHKGLDIQGTVPYQMSLNLCSSWVSNVFWYQDLGLLTATVPAILQDLPPFFMGAPPLDEEDEEEFQSVSSIPVQSSPSYPVRNPFIDRPREYHDHHQGW